MFRWRAWFSRRRAIAHRIDILKRERDQAVRIARNVKRLRDDEVAMLREMLDVYRDTFQSYQVDKQLQAAISKAELARLVTPRDQT